MRAFAPLLVTLPLPVTASLLITTALLITASLLVGPPAAAAACVADAAHATLAAAVPATPAPRPGDVMVSLRLRKESEATWRKLQALGWVQRNELRAMVALPGGRRGCIVIYEGTLPASALERARKLPEVESISPIATPAGR